jgi:hypothetical protein
MSDTYDQNYNGSSNGGYDSSDEVGGGEQIASAIYLNEQLQQVTTIVLSKQNAVVLQPTTPPDNPQPQDQWIDTSIYPNIIYTWDGTQWLRATVTSAQEVGAYTVAQVDDSINLVKIDTDAIDKRVQVTEESLADGEGIASKITATTTYQTDRDGAVTAGVTGLTTNLNDETWVNDNLPKMVTESILQRTSDEIAAMFTKGGGVNIVRNSVGYAGLLNWQVTSGAVSQYVGADCIDAGSGFSIATGVAKQAVSAIAGQPYTLTLKGEERVLLVVHMLKYQMVQIFNK